MDTKSTKLFYQKHHKRVVSNQKLTNQRESKLNLILDLVRFLIDDDAVDIFRLKHAIVVWSLK